MDPTRRVLGIPVQPGRMKKKMLHEVGPRSAQMPPRSPYLGAADVQWNLSGALRASDDRDRKVAAGTPALRAGWQFPGPKGGRPGRSGAPASGRQPAAPSQWLGRDPLALPGSLGRGGPTAPHCHGRGPAGLSGTSRAGRGLGRGAPRGPLGVSPAVWSGWVEGGKD